MSTPNLSLAQLQKHFMAEFTHNSNEVFKDHIKGNQLNNNVEQLLGIYRNNHYGARLSALSNIFPITEQVIGPENFTPLALKYIKKFTSTHWDLNTNGKEFIDFIHVEITDNPHLGELFYLAELSRLEYFFHLSYYAENVPTTTITNQIVEQDAAKLGFIQSPSLYLFETPYPVYQIWINNKEGNGEQPVEHTKKKYFHVVYREEFKPDIETINEPEFVLLSNAINGVSLFDLVNEYGETVTILLPKFIEKKWITPLL